MDILFHRGYLINLGRIAIQPEVVHHTQLNLNSGLPQRGAHINVKALIDQAVLVDC